MKAIVLKAFGGADMMVFREIDQPLPGRDQILIKVAATSVNAPDIVQRQGNYPPPKGDSPILGLEVAGTVAQIGDAVSRWQPNDRVMALIGGGGYAEYAVAHQDHVMPIADAMSFEQAACVCETYLTAYLNLFMLGELSNHQSALLHGGGGGVNTAAIQLCKNLIPDTTLFVTASAGKIERVKQLGVDYVIDYRNQPFVDAIKTHTDGNGVNVILDHIGARYLADNLASLAVYGRLVCIGVTSGIKAELNLAMMMVRRQQIIGSVLRARPVAEKAEIIRRFYRDVGALLANQTIVPMVSDVYALSAAAEAHRAMQQSKHFGKIVLAV